jgi:hypothetical protein
MVILTKHGIRKSTENMANDGKHGFRVLVFFVCPYSAVTKSIITLTVIDCM